MSDCGTTPHRDPTRRQCMVPVGIDGKHASRWLTNGLPLETVQELLGHASIVVTRTVYAHDPGSAVREAYSPMPGGRRVSGG